MKIIYLLLVHNSPEMFGRQIKRLCDSETYFYAHIDKKVDSEPFIKATEGLDNLKFIPDENRILCEWGTFSLVEAVLECVKMASQEHSVGYVVLLSGADYPIKSRDYIREFITVNADTVFISAMKFPVSYWPNGGMDRLTNYAFNLGHRIILQITPYVFSRRNANSYIKILKSKPRLFPKSISVWFKRRKLAVAGFEHYGGEFWFAAPMFSMHSVLNFLSNNPNCTSFYREGAFSDELFFNSILTRDTRAKINLNSCLRYVNWDCTRPEQPAVFTIADKSLLVPMLEKDDMLFARKFSMERDVSILDFIDSYVDND